MSEWRFHVDKALTWRFSALSWRQYALWQVNDHLDAEHIAISDVDNNY